jgi:hypothetical protein
MCDLKELGTKEGRIKLCLEAVKNVKEELNKAILNNEPLTVQLDIMLRLTALRECLEGELERKAA